MAAALVETIAGKGEARADRSNRPAKAASLIGRRYVPPFDYYYKSQWSTIRTHASNELQTVRNGELQQSSPGESWRPTLSRPTAARASSIRRRRSVKSTIDVLIERASAISRRSKGRS